MQKRGTLVLRLILELALSAVLIFSLLSLSRSLGTQQIFVKQSLSQGGALVIQALNKVPGNVVLPYPRDTSDFITRIQGSNFIVIDAEDHKTPFLGRAKAADVQRSKTLYFYK